MARSSALLVTLILALGLKGANAQRELEGKKWVQLHGWLMWTSMGVLFPLGAILIRYSRSQKDPTSQVSEKRKRVLFILHIIVQVLAVLTAISGVVILIRKKGWILDYTHERLGFALLIIVMLQPFIGLIRPKPHTRPRPYWFSLHWLFGTGALFLGVINCYIGIRVYELLSSSSIRSLNIAFSIQIAAFAVVYFLQDRLSYIRGQGYNHLSTKTHAHDRIGL